MTTRYHTSLSVRDALDLNSRALRGMLRDADGTLLTPDETRAALQEQLAGGHEHLPIGTACPGFDYVTGCPGHPMAGEHGEPT